MVDYKAAWDKVRGWYHYPALKEPKIVKGLDGGAAYDFRKRETLIDEGFVESRSRIGKISSEAFVEGVMAHEIGHYMVFPRNLATCILAGKYLSDHFGREQDSDLIGFIFQTYADMANDVASVLEEQRTGAIIGIRAALQAGHEDALNKNVREVMLAYLKEQANLDAPLSKELVPFIKRMKEIDFLSEDPHRLMYNLWVYGNIIIDMVKKYDPEKGNGGGASGLVADHDDSDLKKIIMGAGDGEKKDALRDISGKVTRRAYEKIKEWLKDQGVRLPPVPGPKSIGTSEGELKVDLEVMEYYKQLSTLYPLVVTKKLLDTNASTRSWSDTEKWRPGEDPNLAMPNSSGGLFLPGVTRSIRISQRPIRTTDYLVPHLLVVIDSSGSMPDPKQRKNYADLGGTCAARSYHIHGAHIGVINFSGSSFYHPYTRELDDALAAICAYQGGGTFVDIEMLRKMLGPETAELYSKNPERAIGRVPKEALKKELQLSMSQFNDAFKAESIDLIMFTDGGIFNLGEALELFEEKAELNRATIVLTHGFSQEIREIRDSRINVCRVDDEKDIPDIVIRAAKDSLSSLSRVIK